MCTGFWSFNFNIWRRRHVVKPSSPTRKVDLAETEAHVGITRAESPVHMDESVPVTLTFPHPYDKIVRRYPLDATHSTEPQTDDHLELQQQPFPTQPDHQRHQQHRQHRQHNHGKQPTTPTPHIRRVSIDAKSMRRHTTPILISHRPPIDQLDLDLAYLRSDDLLDDKSKASKPFSSIRPLPKPPVPLVPLPLPPVVAQTSSTQPSSLPISPSTLRPTDHNHSTKKPHHNKNKHSMHDTRNKAAPSSRRKRAATITTTTAPVQNPEPSSLSSSLPSSNFAKEKYYHRLPPSARYLADIARYPNCVDPIRPWNVLKDDHGVTDVKYTNGDANNAEGPTPYQN